MATIPLPADSAKIIIDVLVYDLNLRPDEIVHLQTLKAKTRSRGVRDQDLEAGLAHAKNTLHWVEATQRPGFIRLTTMGFSAASKAPSLTHDSPPVPDADASIGKAPEGGGLTDTELKGDVPEVVGGLLFIFRYENWKRHPLVALLTLTVVVLLIVELLPRDWLQRNKPTTPRELTDPRRNLEYYESQLLPEVKAYAQDAKQAVSIEALSAKFNIATDNLRPRPVSIDGRTFVLSPERGELLAMLVTEGFPFDGRHKQTLKSPSSDLTPLAQANAGGTRSVDLGRINFAGSYVPVDGLRNYNLTRADLSNTTLPAASAFAGSIFRRIPEEPESDFTFEIHTISAKLDGARVPNAQWLRDIEGVLGIENFGALPWRVVQQGPDFVVRPHPDEAVRNAESDLATRANQIASACDWMTAGSEGDLTSCKQEVQGFCDLYNGLFTRTSLTAQERGSLFASAEAAFNVAEVARYRHISSHKYQRSSIQDSMREEYARSTDCIYQATFDGRTDIDISQLKLHFSPSSEGRDFRRVHWKNATIEGYFGRARLPDASEFVLADKIFARNEGWESAIVGSSDWLYRVCIARATPLSLKGDLLELPFFPFTSTALKRVDSTWYALTGVASSCSDDKQSPSSGSPADVKSFCEACAPPPTAASDQR